MARPRGKIPNEHEPIIGVFAARLREARLSRGLTQAGLANRAVVTPTYIAKLEGAKEVAGIELVARPAKALGTSIADPYRGECRLPVSVEAASGQARRGKRRTGTLC